MLGHLAAWFLLWLAGALAFWLGSLPFWLWLSGFLALSLSGSLTFWLSGLFTACAEADNQEKSSQVLNPSQNPQKSVPEAFLESLGAMLGSKIGRRGPALLVESGRLLGSKCQTGPQRVRQWASKGPSSNPKLEAELDPNCTKLKPDGAQSGDLDDLCHRVQVRPMTH